MSDVPRGWRRRVACGTGSILVEAALVGTQAFGSEIDAAVCAGAARNLQNHGLHAEVRLQDALAWAEAGTRFDAIVTDLPYGTLPEPPAGLDRVARFERPSTRA